jgi:DNA-binding response OmpR family regulator
MLSEYLTVEGFDTVCAHSGETGIEEAGRNAFDAIVLDVMQGRIYVNDRQVREKWIKHGIDRANPRAEITVQPLVAQQEPLF